VLLQAFVASASEHPKRSIVLAKNAKETPGPKGEAQLRRKARSTKLHETTPKKLLCFVVLRVIFVDRRSLKQREPQKDLATDFKW